MSHQTFEWKYMKQSQTKSSVGGELAQIAMQLQSQQSKMEGLDRLQVLLSQQGNSGAQLGNVLTLHNGQHLQPIFKGLKSCLLFQETNPDLLLKTNQVIYDMMPDIQKNTRDLQAEVANLIPIFIDNLGNSKPTVRKSTHKCIGTFVKFSKRLEFVIAHLIKIGLNSQNQRTRQHSMLVVPALLTLKATIMDATSPELRSLVDTVIVRLRDPAEIVSKTAKKLLLELNKCYPGTFAPNYISNLASPDERKICELIISNQFDDAQRLIVQTFPSQRMQAALQSQQTQSSSGYSQAPGQNLAVGNQMTAFGKQLKPPSSQSLSQFEPAKPPHPNSTTINSSLTIQSQAQGAPIQTQSVQVLQQIQGGGGKVVPPPSMNRDTRSPALKPTLPPGIQTSDLSVVGREIMSNLTKPAQSTGPALTFQRNQNQFESVPETPQQKAPHIIDRSTAPKQVEIPRQDVPKMEKKVFGFLSPDTIEALNENNQWKDRTAAMETIESLLAQQLSSDSESFDEENATEFMAFIQRFVPDINFKISLASIKLLTTLLAQKKGDPRKHFLSINNHLIEKLSDSKQVVRDTAMKCCATMIDNQSPLLFAQNVLGRISHANWHVREGVVSLLARCLLLQGRVHQGNRNGPDAGVVSLATNSRLLEELCFMIKVEDKAQIVNMGCDVLALAIVKSPEPTKTQEIIEKEIAQDKMTGESKEKRLMDQIQQVVEQDRLPYINKENVLEFMPALPLESKAPSAVFLKSKQELESSQAIGQTRLVASPFIGKTQQKPKETQQVSQSLALEGQGNMKIDAGPIQRHDQPTSINQNKSPSMAFMENKDKQLLEGQQVYPQSAGFRKNRNDSVPKPLVSPNISQQIQSSQKQSISQLAKLNPPDSDAKITQWLPTFSPTPQERGQIDHTGGNSAFSVQTPNPHRQNENIALGNNLQSNAPATSVKQNQREQFDASSARQGVQSLQMKQTASSEATFPDALEGRSTQTTLKQKQIHSRVQGLSNQRVAARSPLFSDTNKTSSAESQSNVRQQFGAGSSSNNSNYVPEAHTNIPRHIQSNQDKQRQYNSSINSDNGSHSPVPDNRGSVNDRLQLLKSTFKYKDPNRTNQADSSSNITPQQISHQTTQSLSVGAQRQFSEDQNLYPSQRNGPIRAAHLKMPEESKQAPPVPPAPQGIGSKKMSAELPVSHVQLRQRQQVNSANKPTIDPDERPLNIGKKQSPSVTQYDEYSRVSSIDYQSKDFNAPNFSQYNGASSVHNTTYQSDSTMKGLGSPQRVNHPVTEKKTGGFPGGLSINEQSSADQYEVKEEPLHQPEKQVEKATHDLASKDWQVQFEACNIIKRSAMFHKNIYSSNRFASDVFKSLVKPLDSLRSQVSKQASLTLQTLYQELGPREVDPNLEIVMPTLLKRSIDTNHFISDTAEKALFEMINAASESRIFSCIQSQPLKSNPMKEKVCSCYTVFIERLGQRIKNFRDIERVVQQIVVFLGESAVECRNQAKMALLTLQQSLGSQRDLDGVLLKCRLNERQMDKVRKVLQSEDFESLSNYAQTRYGGSMRASPLHVGARSTQYSQPGDHQNNVYGQASGSDGFARHNNMQQTFLSSGAGVPTGKRRVAEGNSAGSQMLNIPRPGPFSSGAHSSTGFDRSQNTFKKRNTSVAKPLDRNMMESFKTLIDGCREKDWSKRVRAIDNLQSFSEKNSVTIRNAQPSSFISLLDAYCQLLQDNNTKVQTHAQQSFQTILCNADLSPLMNSNLTMIVQALAQNLCSTNMAVKREGDNMLDLLEQIVVAEQRGTSNNLLQPLVSQVNQTNNKAKHLLVEKLINIVERVDKPTMIERYIGPLLQPNSKIQQEARGNVDLKSALQRLEMAINGGGSGLGSIGIGLQRQY